MTQKQKHTPEPWDNVTDAVAWIYPEEPTYDGNKWKDNWGVTLSERSAKYRAGSRKIYPLYLDPAAEIAALKAQRDELLAALNVCAASLCTYGSHPIIEKQVNNAINKAKGGRP